MQDPMSLIAEGIMGKKIAISASLRNAYSQLSDRYEMLCKTRKHPGSDLVQIAMDAVDPRAKKDKLPSMMTEEDATKVNAGLTELQRAIEIFDESTK